MRLSIEDRESRAVASILRGAIGEALWGVMKETFPSSERLDSKENLLPPVDAQVAQADESSETVLRAGGWNVILKNLCRGRPGEEWPGSGRAGVQRQHRAHPQDSV